MIYKIMDVINMAMPHIIQMRLIRERLKGKEGKAKLREIEEIQSELPGFNNGPYGEIKKWLVEEIEKTKTRSKIKHQDWLSIKKQGIKQFVLVGCPNVGKSSLINKLSGLQTKIANYEFTTLKPIPGVVDINGAEFQIIDLPGLVEGAVDDVGGGRRLIGIVKGSDGIILMHDLTKPLADVEKIVNELEKAKITKPLIVVGSKSDLVESKNAKTILSSRFSNHLVIFVSTMTNEGILALRDALWNISNLIRVNSKGQEHSMILEKNSTVRNFVEHIHRDLVNKFRFARISGPSARFENQQVGLDHELQDMDVVEVVLAR
jgi:uncharacterized protein